MTTSSNVDLTKVLSTSEMRGEDEEETARFRSMLAEASDYLRGFSWCAGIKESYLGIGVGGVIAIFLFHIQPVRKDVDRWVWVVVGDVPPAYIDTTNAPNPACALDAYIGAMTEWVQAVKRAEPTTDLIPVNAEATQENAEALESRLAFLDREVLSQYPDDLRA